jgi:hypothetical protein
MLAGKDAVSALALKSCRNVRRFVATGGTSLDNFVRRLPSKIYLLVVAERSQDGDISATARCVRKTYLIKPAGNYLHSIFVA